MIRQITDDGYLKFDTVGAIDRRVLLGKPVLVGPKRVPGVVGLKAYHLVSREEEKSVPKLDEFYIDIGARDRAGAEAQVALGDTAAFDSDAGDFGAGLFQGKALGSRLGCAVLLTLLRDELPMDCTFVFTAQKEVGARGAFGAAFSVTPEVALVVDGADAADLAGVPAHKQGCSLGGGVVLPYMGSISFGSAGFHVDGEDRLLETTIYHPAPSTLALRLAQPDTQVVYSEEFRNPCALYTTEDGSRYKVWYENEQSVLDKVALARMFGITGVSLWRIGNIPADGAYDVWSALLTQR